MSARDLDREERAARFLDAMASVEDLLSGRVPGMMVDAVPLAQLIGLLNAEAQAVVPKYAPGPYGWNDNDGGDG